MNRGLGLQRRSAFCVFAVLWPVGAPLLLLSTDSVLAVWQRMPMIYLTLDALQVTSAFPSHAAHSHRHSSHIYRP
tara:strand:+ start:64 stop:288 length:225 start_codon:yes stop_codon:yes gene_type:complete